MESYLQLGWASDNLLEESSALGFSGAIISPVDLEQSKVESRIKACSSLGLDFVLDPQLFIPADPVRSLSEWSFWPDVFKTQDSSDIKSWHQLADQVLECADSIGCNTIASPAILPKVFDDEYYSFFASVDKHARDSAPDGISVLQTVIVEADRLVDESNVYKIASLVSAHRADGYYLIFLDPQQPRPASSDVESLVNQAKLIRALRSTGARVVVGHTFVDAILFGAAGASACATGKYLNVRNFEIKRFKPPRSGGGQKTYWFEESVLNLVAVEDMTSLAADGLLSEHTLYNRYIDEVRTCITQNRPWLRLSWLQYLNWFSIRACSVTPNNGLADDLLLSARKTFEKVRDERIDLHDTVNDKFVRAFIRAFKDLG